MCLSLGAQVVDAERSVIGWIAAAIPALGFLVMVKVALAQGGGPSAVTTPKLRVVDVAEDAMLLAAARTAAEELERQGRRVSRQALAEALRATGHAVSNAKASALLQALKAEAAEEDPHAAEHRRRFRPHPRTVPSAGGQSIGQRPGHSAADARVAGRAVSD